MQPVENRAFGGIGLKMALYCTYITIGAKESKLNVNMMLANIVTVTTQFCQFCHRFFRNEEKYVTELVGNEPTKTNLILSCNPKRLTQMSYKYSDNSFSRCRCCKNCCSTLLCPMNRINKNAKHGNRY